MEVIIGAPSDRDWETEKKDKYEGLEFRDLMNSVGGKTGHAEDTKHTKERPVKKRKK